MSIDLLHVRHVFVWLLYSVSFNQDMYLNFRSTNRASGDMSCMSSMSDSSND